MKLDSIYKTTKKGIMVELRSAGISDAADEIGYLKQVCGETPFLLCEAEDVNYSIEGEESFLERYENSDRALMLNAYVEGELAGNSSFDAVSTAKRLSHRASLGIAVFRKFSGMGIGELMISTLLEKAAESGYEIMELDVFSKNERALGLYEKLGFKECGRLKNAVKYKDGSYDDIILMQCFL